MLRTALKLKVPKITKLDYNGFWSDELEVLWRLLPNNVFLIRNAVSRNYFPAPIKTATEILVPYVPPSTEIVLRNGVAHRNVKTYAYA